MKNPAGVDKAPEIIYPLGRGMAFLQHNGFITPSRILRAASIIYSAAHKTRKHFRGTPSEAHLEDCRIISVGNIEGGGTGKTPFSMLIIEELIRTGYKPVYISRGYKSTAENLDAATVVLPDPLKTFMTLSAPARLLKKDSPVLYREIGDEGAVVAGRFKSLPLILARDKTLAVKIAAGSFRPTHIVLDDAFQSHLVHRDLDVVLLDASNSRGDMKFLRRGFLRESMNSLRRADYIGLTGGPAGFDDENKKSISTLTGIKEDRIFILRKRISFPLEDNAGMAVSGMPVAALSSIAKHGEFEIALANRNVFVKTAIRFPDHHDYKEGDIDRIKEYAVSRKISTVVTTEKDWVKLCSRDWEGIRLVLAGLELECIGEGVISAAKKPQPEAAVF